MIKTYMKGDKKYATSTYFDDMNLLKQSKKDTSREYYNLDQQYRQKLEISYAASLIRFWHLGCKELTEWALAQHPESDYITVYKGENWKEANISL